VFIRDQVKAGRQCSVRSDQGAVVACPAVPGLHLTAHSFFECPQVGDGVHHGPPLFLLFDQPVQEFIDLIVLPWCDAQHVIVMLVMIHLNKAVGRLVKVVIGSDMVLVGDLCEQLDIFDVVSADIGVEKDDISILKFRTPELA